MLAYINWDVSPIMIGLGPLEIRWYGLMFAIGFLVGYAIVAKMFKHEGAPERWLSPLLIILVVCTVVGARLGHVFFYEWDYYTQHPSEIIKVWEGGLASHGGAIANFIGLCIFSWVVAKKNPSWVIDKIVVPIALVGGLIRMGNLFNSEIYGGPTDLPWGFIFVRDGLTYPSHPTQLYEALAYFTLFGVLMFMYWKKNAEQRPWLLTGVFFLWTFGARFLIEFVKNPQEAWESDMTINMGQILSIPFIVLGAALIVYALMRPAQHWTFPGKFAEELNKKQK
ncbi:MAG: prolipoprotein diacylglyceryl transferase [Prevotella sp.]|nr:prolipoprotein diacylglyceryl transferase [Prevotella sp.]MCM1074752.1 prolipoprotein diacylglyceryl transferase [Ruminococcus sp.]